MQNFESEVKCIYRYGSHVWLAWLAGSHIGNTRCCQHPYRSKRSQWIRSSCFLEIRLLFHIESQQKGCWLRLTFNWKRTFSLSMKNNAFFRGVRPISIHLFSKCSERVLSSHSPIGATFFRK